MLNIKDEIINEIQKSVPFPQETFDMTIDDEINFMKFVKDKNTGKFKKKNYMYVAKNNKTQQFNKLVMKGLPIIKSNASKVAKKIFDKYMTPEIINNHKHKFKKKMVVEWIENELEKDLSLAAIFYKIRNYNEYALDSQIQAQIAKHELYGEGQHYMLKLNKSAPYITQNNKKISIGAGKMQNYVGIKYKDYISLKDLDLQKTWNELNPFVETNQKKLNLFL